MPEILSRRTELPDGTMNAAVTAERVAEQAAPILKEVEKEIGQTWACALNRLQDLESAASTASLRCDGVRKYFGMGYSSVAATIQKIFPE
jgi:hypothetical protein